MNNNPLSFTDPSGYFFKKLFKLEKTIHKTVHKNFLFVSGSKTVLYLAKKYPWVGVIVQIVAAYFCGPCAAGVAALITESNGGSITDIFKAAAISYVSAQAYGSSGGSGFTKVVAHGVVGGLSSAASGGEFKHVFLSAGFAQAFSGNISKGFPDSMPSRVIATAVIGGTAAKLGGGKFANGAVTVAFAHLFSNMPAANDDNYGMVSDAEMNYIMGTSPRTSALWEVPQPVVDFVAGFGDTISFGATNWVRGQLDVNGAVNFDSGAYQGGKYAGYAYFSTAGGIAAARGAVALSPGGQIIGHPSYGGRTIEDLRSGQFRFGWSRNNGPTLRMGVRSKHIDFVRLRPPGQ